MTRAVAPTVTSIWASGPSDLWAVTISGGVSHFDGASATVHAQGFLFGGPVTRLTVVGPGDVWLATVDLHQLAHAGPTRGLAFRRGSISSMRAASLLIVGPLPGIPSASAGGLAIARPQQPQVNERDQYPARDEEHGPEPDGLGIARLEHGR